MMDLKEIIKWFIPCFHILLKLMLNKKWFFVCLFLLFNIVNSSKVHKLNSELDISENVEKNLEDTKNLDDKSVFYEENNNSSQSDGFPEDKPHIDEPRLLEDSTIARTFGGPRVKKMLFAMLPVIFQMGAASTWAVIATLVGVKTLLITLAILKLLLVAGAAKIGALFASKSHHHHGWEPPHQKEIHLHIHNGNHEHEEHPISSPWSRDGYTTDSKPVYLYEPYHAGPQTIKTPYGSYVKIDSSPSLPGPVTLASK